jgi:hypothetical protein
LIESEIWGPYYPYGVQVLSIGYHALIPEARDWALNYGLTFPVLADEVGDVTLDYADPFGWGFPFLPWDAIVSVDRILMLSEDLYEPSGDSLFMSRVIPIFDSLFAPTIASNPEVLDFGDVPVDTFAQAQIVLDNSGTGLLEITDIVPSSPVFSVDVTQGEIFAMDDSLTVTVTFTPIEEIPYSETLSVISPDDTLEVDLFGSGAPVGIKRNPLLPRSFAVSCYPNPFNSEISIQVDLGRRDHLSVAVYDLQGKKTAQLWEGGLESGVHRWSWSPEEAPSGMYLVKIRGDGWSEVRKVVMIR